MLYEIDGKQAFRIDLYNHSVAHKWKKLIQNIYVGDGEDIDHKRSFFHLRPKSEVKEILLNAIKNINEFIKKDFIKVPETLDWDDQDFYNSLHIAFEKLSGEFDNPTKLMKIAPNSVKESVRDLNFCVHALEHGSDNKNINTFPIQWTKARKTLPRVKLLPNEYDLIQFDMKENEVYLAYNELGKTFIDLWHDNLPIDYNAVKNNHYIGADIKISLCNNPNIFEQGFLDWCGENNVDAFDKKLGIGVLPIGKVNTINTEHLTKDSKANIIIERTKI